MIGPLALFPCECCKSAMTEAIISFRKPRTPEVNLCKGPGYFIAIQDPSTFQRVPNQNQVALCKLNLSSLIFGARKVIS